MEDKQDVALSGHFLDIDEADCRRLLRERGVGRVSWRSGTETLVLPVCYVVDRDRIVIRTRPGTVIADLAQGADVSFQIDEIDPETATGWSVLVQGRAELETGDVALPRPWVPGPNPIVISIAATRATGRIVSL